MAASPAIVPECFPLFEGVEVPKPVLGQVLGHSHRVLPDLGVEAERGEGLQEVLLHALHVSKPLPQHLQKQIHQLAPTIIYIVIFITLLTLALMTKSANFLVMATFLLPTMMVRLNGGGALSSSVW